MKTKLHIKILTTLFITIFIVGSARTQNVITSVNVQKNAEILTKQLDQNVAIKELKLIKAENWMQNKAYLDNHSSLELYRVKMLLHEKVVENDRNIESWMTEKSFWNIKDSQFNSLDKEHKLEDWMFNTSFYSLHDDTEKCCLEDWMFDKRFWVMVK